MKLRIALLIAVGIAGLGTSIALADGGHGKSSDAGGCQHAQLSGSVAGPQSFTVTVTKAGKHGNFTAGQVVTVSLGATGQTVRFHGEGCVGTDGTLTVREAELHGQRAHSHDGEGGTTTTATTTSSTTTTTTTTSH